MFRQEVDFTDFQIEIEKMIAKEKYNASNNGEEDEDSGISSGEETDTETEEMSEVIEAKASMVYEKSEKVLDLGKLKVTDYKFNKFVHLPRAQKADKEAKHEVRKQAMEAVFKEVCGKDTDKTMKNLLKNKIEEKKKITPSKKKEEGKRH